MINNCFQPEANLRNGSYGVKNRAVNPTTTKETGFLILFNAEGMQLAEVAHELQKTETDLGWGR